MECKIKISELRSVINTILDNLEIATEGGAVVVERDMYWEIFSHEKYDIRKMPVEFGIGQLFDDWNFLKHILIDNDVAAKGMLIHVAPILMYIGESVVSCSDSAPPNSMGNK